MIPEAFKEWVRQYVASSLRVSKVGRTSADGETDAVEGHLTLPGEPSYQHDANRFEPWGVRTHPVPGVDAAWYFVHGGTTGAIVVGTHTTEYGPTLEAGEVALYCKTSGAVVKLDKNGAITITAAANQNINVTASGTGEVNVSATAVTGKVGLGPVANLAVLVQGTTDGVFGSPVIQAPAATATIVKAG